MAVTAKSFLSLAELSDAARRTCAALPATAFVAVLAGVPLSGMPMLAAAQPSAFYSSFEDGDTLPAGQGESGLAIERTGGPPKEAVFTAKADVGFTGLHSLRYSGKASGRARSVKLFDVDVPVAADTRLSYRVFPRSREGDLHNGATYVALDLVFDDGSRLSQRQPRDEYNMLLTARGQGEARLLYPDQWNSVATRLGDIAPGRRIRQIVLVHDDSGREPFEGYVDDVRLASEPLPQITRLSDYVDTRRGSNSNMKYSRGNNFPAVAVPHGFNFWTATTQAESNWIYQYQERNGPDNRPRIEALALSHEPSPWMGDRQTFHILPAIAQGVPEIDRQKRALSFTHDNETARADYYGVRFDNGIVAEITPTDHAAMMRFTFPGDAAQLVFDNRDNEGGITLDPEKRSISGWSDSKSKLSTGATRLFFYAVFDRPVKGGGRLTGAGRDAVTAWLGFDVTGTPRREVNMRIATSLLSVEQAKRNLALEIADSDDFDSVRERARKTWDDQLAIARIEGAGASHQEQVTLYSNLYRLFLYPNRGHENVGTAQKPVYRYASPFSAATGESTPTRTGARIVDGQVYVNNGFWDTYRTAWPAYTLLTPITAGEMIDGFVQQYRDGGWIARWTSPGYADLMVGTSSDVAFADAWLKGVRNFDVMSFYRSALKNAAVVSPIPGAGRKGIERAAFTGYADTSVSEGLSWSMDSYINDFAIGNLAAALAAQGPADDAYRAHYADDAVYYLNRALGYTNLFNPQIGFFVGRNPNGAWRYDVSNFNPLRWGDDYTETNAWNMAFHAPHDSAGLAALYGGRTALGAKLDRFFATPGTFDVGSYGGPIHEMLEARDVRMGQYGHSNQPSHHILYMYGAAGQPWKTQDKVRDLLNRVYSGSDIGQGYPGDEDNGEMSAWWIFSSAGFYPLRMGAPEYMIGAPRFEKMTLKLESGREIRINAPGVSDRNRYVQSLQVNGQPWTSLTLPHSVLAEGAVLDFRMGPAPSSWGSQPEALPASLTTDGERPNPLRDITTRENVSASGIDDPARAAALADDDSGTTLRWAGASPSVSYRLSAPATVALYTLTSTAGSADPREWQLQGSNDGEHWTTLDERRGETFPWRRQTRAFAVAQPAEYSQYRLKFAQSGALELAEIELLSRRAAAK